MAKEKQYVFSARTTEEGLKALNEVKSCFNIGWDEMVIDGMCGHDKLDKTVLSLPKKAAAVKEQEKPKVKGGKNTTNKRTPNKVTPSTSNAAIGLPPPEQ